MYANYEDGKFSMIYESKIQVEMCGCSSKPVEIFIREVQNGEESPYWGWWLEEKQKYSMIYSSVIGCKMCFPDYGKLYIESGKGKIVNLFIGLVE